MRTRTSRTAVVVTTVVLGLLALNGIAVHAASPAQDTTRTGQGRGIFGDVRGVNGPNILIQLANGQEVTVTITAETSFRAAGVATGIAVSVEVGTRVAVVLTDQAGSVAKSVMVLNPKARAEVKPVVHIRGVVSLRADGTFTVVSTEGREYTVDFGLRGTDLTEGTVVTIVGKVDEATGVLRAQSVQALTQTLERLKSQTAHVEDEVVERDDQVRHLARLRQVAQQLSEQQLNLVQRLQSRLGERAAAEALQQAVKHAQDAQETLERALDRAVEITGKGERELLQDTLSRALPHGARPTLGDIAAALGLDEEALANALKAGQSVSDIASARGVTLEQLAERLVERVRAKLADLVAKGDISSETADLILARVRQEIAEHIRKVFAEAKPHDDLPLSMEEIASALGLKVEEVFAHLRSGATIAELLAKAGNTEQQLLDALVAIARRHLQDAVKTNVLKTDEIDRYLERFREKAKRSLTRLADVREAPEEPRERPPVGDVDGHGLAGINIPFNPSVLAEALGMSVQDLMQALKEGTSVEDLAARRTLTIPHVLDRLLASVRGHLRELIAKGQIDQATADRILATARERLERDLRAFRADRTPERPATRPTPQVRGTDTPVEGLPITIQDIADTLGASVDDVRKALAGPGGLRKLLADRNVDVETLVTRLLDKARAVLLARLQAERRGQAQLEEVLAHYRRKLLHEFGKRAEVRATSSARDVPVSAGLLPFNAEMVAKVLGLSVDDLRQQLADGKTVADIAAARNVPLDGIADILLGETLRQAQALVANGRVTQREVDEKLRSAREDILRGLREFRASANERVRAVQERTSNEGKERGERALTEQEREKLKQEAGRRKEALERGSEHLQNIREQIENLLKQDARALPPARLDAVKQLLERLPAGPDRDELRKRLAQLEQRVREASTGRDRPGPATSADVQALQARITALKRQIESAAPGPDRERLQQELTAIEERLKALEQAPRTGQAALKAKGIIKSIGSVASTLGRGSITIQTAEGATLTLTVNADTQFAINESGVPDRRVASVSDLPAGATVAVTYTSDGVVLRLEVTVPGLPAEKTPTPRR